MDIREIECMFSGCPAYRECTVKYGNLCTRNGGRKVPRFDNHVYSEPPNVHLVTSCGGPDDDITTRYSTDPYFD